MSTRSDYWLGGNLKAYFTVKSFVFILLIHFFFYLIFRNIINILIIDFFLNQFILKKKKNIKINDRNLILLLNLEPLLVQSIFYILTMNEKKKIIIIIYLFFSQVKL